MTWRKPAAEPLGSRSRARESRAARPPVFRDTLVMRQQQQQTSTPIVRRRRRSSRLPAGNALLDLAFILPILLGLTFGAVEYGYAVYVKHALQGAAREGARRAIIAGATATQVQAAVDDSLQQAGFPQNKYTRPATITP